MREEPDLAIVRAQIGFFRANRAGCAFAAYAARHPKTFGWHHRLLEVKAAAIDHAIKEAIADPSISSLSLIFKDCRELQDLYQLIGVLEQCRYVVLGQDETFLGHRCLGFRARVGQLQSWISGFGPYDFLPKTRQSPHTELVMRVKPRPPYKKIMKKAPEGVIHLADMNMLAIPDNLFKRLWSASFTRTAAILGHRPDRRSAAKTTFAIPV